MVAVDPLSPGPCARCLLQPTRRGGTSPRRRGRHGQSLKYGGHGRAQQRRHGEVPVLLPGTGSFLGPSRSTRPLQLLTLNNPEAFREPVSRSAGVGSVHPRASSSGAGCRFPPCKRGSGQAGVAPAPGAAGGTHPAPSSARSSARTPRSSPDPPALVPSGSCEAGEANAPAPGSSPRTMPKDVPLGSSSPQLWLPGRTTRSPQSFTSFGHSLGRQ